MMRGRLLVFCFLFGWHAAAAADDACVFCDERELVMAVMNLQNDLAAQHIAQLDEQTALIPSRDYYRALARWLVAYQTEDTASKRNAIADMRSAVRSLEEAWPADSKRPGLGIATGHLARILLEDEQYVRGFRTGMRAVALLDTYLATAQPTDPGYHDAQFLQGIYEVYSADASSRAEWLPRSFRHRGNRREGIALIESAIQGGAVFAADAGRTLLAEVIWRRPDVCRYIEMIDALGERLPDNQDVATLRQGLLLKCGYPERAERVNQIVQARERVSRSMVSRARLRILASLGDVDTIRTLTVDEALEDDHALALANALDVAGERSRALKRYQTLESTPGVSPAIRRVARVRQSFAFSAPKRIQISQFDPCQFSRCAQN